MPAAAHQLRVAARTPPRTRRPRRRLLRATSTFGGRIPDETRERSCQPREQHRISARCWSRKISRPASGGVRGVWAGRSLGEQTAFRYPLLTSKSQIEPQQCVGAAARVLRGPRITNRQKCVDPKVSRHCGTCRVSVEELMCAMRSLLAHRNRVTLEDRNLAVWTKMSEQQNRRTFVSRCAATAICVSSNSWRVPAGARSARAPGAFSNERDAGSESEQRPPHARAVSHPLQDEQ